MLTAHSRATTRCNDVNGTASETDLTASFKAFITNNGSTALDPFPPDPSEYRHPFYYSVTGLIDSVPMVRPACCHHACAVSAWLSLQS